MLESELDVLREEMRKSISEKRFAHTLGVEREAKALCEIYLPERVSEMRAAALLHDITKEKSTKEHTELLEGYGIKAPEGYARNPKLFHALTGAHIARKKFGEYVDGGVFSAILYHTTGRRGMTLEDKIIYLADYIEDTRTFDDCVKLRKYFYDSIKSAKTDREKLAVLDRTLLYSFDLTVKSLILEGAEIDMNTVDARNYIIEELRRSE